MPAIKSPIHDPQLEEKLFKLSKQISQLKDIDYDHKDYPKSPRKQHDMARANRYILWNESFDGKLKNSDFDLNQKY